jgi:hypothetical protein
VVKRSKAVLAVALVVAIATTCWEPVLSAQTFITPKGEAQNVRFEQRESGIVEIFYDLISSDPRAVFTVAVEGSQDGGSTWGMRPQTMTGDVGAGITPGVGKKIVWDSGKDMERVQFNSLRFRMVATGGPLASNAKPVPAGQTQKPPANQSSGGGGGKKKWIFIGGGVAAAGATAAVLLGGGKAAPPTVTNSSIVGNSGTLLASISSLTFVVNVTNPEGDALTASFNFGDGTTGSAAVSGAGEATVSKTYTTAGSYSPTVTINGGKGGTATASFATVTVASLTGRWAGTWTTVAGLTASLTLTQSGTAISGDVTVSGSPNFTNPGRVTGTVRAPFNVTMTLTGANGVFYEIDVNGTGALSTFSGNAVGASTLAWVMTRQ